MGNLIRWAIRNPPAFRFNLTKTRSLDNREEDDIVQGSTRLEATVLKTIYPKFRMIVFDVDGTLTQVASIWEYLHRKLGIWESEGRPNLEAFTRREIDYAEFARRDALGYKGLSRKELMELIRSVPMRPGMDACLAFFKQRGIPIALISTGLDIMLDAIPLADIRVANELVFQDDNCTGEAVVHIPIDGKKEVFDRILRDHRIQADQIIAAGDSRGDIEILRSAGLSIAVASTDPAVRDASDICLDSGDLSLVPQIVERFEIL